MATPWTDEQRAKFKATMAAKKAEKQGLGGNAPPAYVPKKRKAKKRTVQSIPLEAIPDAPKKKAKKFGYAKDHPAKMTREKAVFEIIRLATWLAQN